MSISATAENPNAARLFLAWSLTQEGQAAWNTETSAAPAFPDGVEGTLPLGDYNRIDVQEATDRTSEIASLLGFE